MKANLPATAPTRLAHAGRDAGPAPTSGAPAAPPDVRLGAAEHTLLMRRGNVAQTTRRERATVTRLPRLDTAAKADARRATPASTTSSASGTPVFSPATSVGTPLTPMSPSPDLSRASTGRSSTHPTVDARSDELVGRIHALLGPQAGEHVRNRFDQIAGLATDQTRHALALGIQELHRAVESEIGGSRSGIQTFQNKGSLWRAQIGGLFGKPLTRARSDLSGAAIAQRRASFLEGFDQTADRLMQRFGGDPS